MAVIGYASNKEQAKEMFAKQFENWVEMGCEASSGVVQNPVVQYLFTPSALQILTKENGKATLVAHASIHINLS